MIANNVLGVPSFSLRSWGHGVLRNLLYSCYYGCCMAMRAEFMMKILPFSEKTIAYDQLIGLVAEKYHTSYFLKTPLIKRREHGDNMSRKRGIVEKMRFRYKVWQSYSETIKKNNF